MSNEQILSIFSYVYNINFVTNELESQKYVFFKDIHSYINIYMSENFEITAWLPSLGLIISENAKSFRVLLEF